MHRVSRKRRSCRGIFPPRLSAFILLSPFSLIQLFQFVFHYLLIPEFVRNSGTYPPRKETREPDKVPARKEVN
jgi:hypothetical protein